MFKSIISVFVFGVALSNAAYAIPLPKNGFSPVSPSTSFMWESLAVDAKYDFEGIVALSNCSGSLIQLENATDNDTGLILTNGHCLDEGFPAPGTFVSHKPSRRAFRLLAKDGDSVGRVTATEIIYATMTKTDMAIYKLKETYAEIFTRFGIRPYRLSNQRAVETDNIEVISGFWKKGYSCAVEAFIPKLKEGVWTWEDSIRYSRPGCEVIGGTSGSPVILTGTKTVIGVNNTGNENGERCTDNNPCEVDAEGNISFEKGFSYGQQTYWLYSCVDPNNNVDIALTGCLLPH